MDDREELEKAIRELVKRMYSDLFGAYGSADYEGQYEDEIQALVDAITAHLEDNHDRKSRTNTRAD